MAKILMYSTDPCSFCSSAKRLLATRAIVYEEVNLAKDPDGRMELAQRTGMMSFPQIVVDGELLGGFRELALADQSGRLSELVADAA
ncbi:MAG: glutaredoxin [Actinomycetota bacterium]|nr:glutaredoxin [Actinomycetota bacterium]